MINRKLKPFVAVHFRFIIIDNLLIYKQNKLKLSMESKNMMNYENLCTIINILFLHTRR